MRGVLPFVMSFYEIPRFRTFFLEPRLLELVAGLSLFFGSHLFSADHLSLFQKSTR